MDSPVFSYLLNHNVDKMDSSIIAEAKEKTSNEKAL